MITTFGETMLRISPSNPAERISQAINFRIEPGGSESNVAIALANLGLKTRFVTALPENTLSQKVIQQLKQFDVDTSQIILQGDRIGTYWTETGIGPRSSFVIYDRESSAFSQASFEDYRWDKIFSESTWFHFSGISPAVSKIVASLLKQAISKCGCPYSVDLNYRGKLWKWADKDKTTINQAMTELCADATLIAGNETDFLEVFNINSQNNNDDDNYQEVAKQCFTKFDKAKYIAISNRKSLSASQNEWNGYLFVKNDKQFRYKGMTYQLDSIQDRVGTGDSFVAGIIYGLILGDKYNYQEVVDFAVTLSSLNHTIKGDASRFSLREVRNAMRSKGSGRIIR